MDEAGRVAPKLSKGQQTSLRIQMVAVDLVLEHGIGGTTVELICKASKVSERTFFNYFKTKELAIIGDELPEIDESKARSFLAAAPGDIFTEALDLIPMQSLNQIQPELFFKRLEMMAKHPELFALNMSKLMSIRNELRELIFLRLRRNAPATIDEDELRVAASFISEIAASYFRASVERGLLSPGTPSLPPLGGVGVDLERIIAIGLRS